MYLLSFCLSFLFLCFYTLAERNDSPIIGVLAQEVKSPQDNRTSYIAASYVKFLESAGARVVPVMINKTPEEYKALFNSINGILYPGGAASIFSSGYEKAARIFYEFAIEAKKKGDYFPVWGTCLGFEQLMYLTSGKSVLSRTNTTGLALPLNFTNEINGSRLFENFPPQLMQDLASQALTENSHKWSVTMETYSEDEELHKFYKILSTNMDGTTEFLSTVEAYDYPFYATQWHPEKNPFEWTRPHYPHSPSAVKLSFYMAKFFVDEARKNLHRFESVDLEQDALIYNYSPLYTGRESIFEQVYYF